MSFVAERDIRSTTCALKLWVRFVSEAGGVKDVVMSWPNLRAQSVAEGTN